MKTERNGFIAADLEESIAAPGSGEGVAGITCSTIQYSIDASIYCVIAGNDVIAVLQQIS